MRSVTLLGSVFFVALILADGAAAKTLSVAPSATGNAASPLDDFDAVQAHYFPMLDLRASSAQLTALPAFASQLSKIADATRAQLVQGTISGPEQTAKAGLVMIYDALMMHNNTDAALNGGLSLASLVASRRFAAAGASDQDELLARARYALANLALAAQLRPDDRRIDSWTVAVQASIERIQNGQVSEAALTKVLDTIDERPTFNLWTALLIFRGRDASSELYGRLVAAAKDFVDSASDPCSQHPQDCQNGPHAPYSFQSSVTVLGDAFLRRANRLMQDGRVGDAMLLAHYAQGTYARLNAPTHGLDTQAWPDRSAIGPRIDAVQKLLNAQTLNDVSFVASDDFRRAYECSACHGRAVE